MTEKMEQTQETRSREDEPLNDELKPAKGKFRRILRLGCSIAIGGGVVVILLNPVCTPTMGAPRSAQLRFEQRKAEIEQAIGEEHLEGSLPSGTCSPPQEAKK
ncbi:MAG: hypothetical protein ACYSX1_11020 [Planctomycetota bacterium]|jgi:hypothetical protein